MTEINLDPIIATIKTIASFGVPILIKKLERDEFVIKIKQKLKLDPYCPPEDFEGIYMYTLVEYGVDKPKRILELFRDQTIILAFRKAFERNEPSIFWNEVENFFEVDTLEDISRSLKINVRDELNVFNERFEDVAARTRLPAEVILDRRLKEIQESLNPPWEQLWRRANRTDQMGPVLVLEETLGMYTPPSDYPKVVPLGSRIRFEVNLDNAGHLLLLDKDESGEVWCLCPSCFAPDPKLKAGKTILPQKGSRQTSFELKTAGLERILAVITKEVPTLDWLPQGSDKPLQLNETHLTRLLEYVNQSGDCKLLYTTYKINA